MSKFPFFPVDVDAYLGATRHLNAQQHGAYFLLLMECWRRPNCSLPNDDDMLARLACLSPEEWQIIKPVIMQFFEYDGRSKGFTQTRLKKERNYVQSVRQKKSDAATSRWKQKKKDDANADALSLSLSHIKKPTKVGTKKQEKKAVRGTRIPDDWVATPEHIEFAMANGFSLQDAHAEADNFKDYWTAKTSQATKLDWFATWRVWIRRSKKGNGNRQKKPSVLDAARNIGWNVD
jgi:uncharacterized protein YdaU (DUF1376 family)